MSNPFQLTFTLKQHTPIIHFQHDQDGATLRATEVKPKLDRFILMKIGREADPNLINENEIYDKGKEVANRKKWLIDSGKGALDYKMRIEPIDAVNSIPIMYSTTNDGKFRPNFPTIFGNVDSHQKKVFRFAEKQKLTITCTKVELSDKFNQWIGMFFSLNNFGFRQSKGFGSFTIDNKSMVLGSKLFFTLNHGITEYYEVFRDIDLFYRCLKSGINIKTREDPKDKKSKLIDKMYLKSLMFKFAKSLSKPEQWDKRTIRHALFLNNYKYKDDKKEDGIFYNRRNPDGTVQFTVAQAEGTNYFDFRDLLGLSTEQDWLFYSSKIEKSVSKSIIKNGKDEKMQIERFASPLWFKPIYSEEAQNWFIYLITNNIPPEYSGADVIVSNKTNHIALTIYPTFDLNNFLKKSIKAFDKNDIEFGAGFAEENVPEALILSDIFTQLQTQIG